MALHVAVWASPPGNAEVGGLRRAVPLVLAVSKIVGAFLALDASVAPTLAHPVCQPPAREDHERRAWVDEEEPLAAGAP